MADPVQKSQSQVHTLGAASDMKVGRYDLSSSVGRTICAMVLGAGDNSETDAIVNRFRETLEARGLCANLIMGGVAPDGTAVGIIGVESPGRLMLLFLPTDGKIESQPEQWIAVLQQAHVEAGRSGMAIVQALVEPGDRWRSRVLQQAGFRKLADLVYMDRSLALPPPAASSLTGLFRFLTLREVGDVVLGATLAATYEGSQDCPALNGRRSLEDILAAHRASGEFDPDLWFAAEIDGQRSGVLLLAPIPDSSTVELVYMGVVPAFRGRGVGDELLRQACRVCRARGYSSLTLAVDSANPFALKLYERWRFRSVGRRIAWVSFPDSETANEKS